jgi:hypothetical protein
VKRLCISKTGVKYFFPVIMSAGLLLCASCYTETNKTAEPAQSRISPFKPSKVVSETALPSLSPASGISATDKVLPSLTLSPGISTAGQASPVSTLLSGVKITLKMNNQPSPKGDAFTVAVELSTSLALRGIQWKLTFDSRAMQLQNINEGNVFKDWAKANNGTTIVFPKPAIDNNSGNVSDMGIVIMSKTSGGVTGIGTLCVYDFIALLDQVGTPVISDVVLCDIAGKTFSYGEIAK